jgi:hypothetical protein
MWFDEWAGVRGSELGWEGDSMDDRERESEIGWEGSSWDERERVWMNERKLGWERGSCGRERAGMRGGEFGWEVES